MALTPKEQEKLKVQLQTLLFDLADTAVSKGRMNWDSYYGYDNSFHLDALEEWAPYKAVMSLFEEVANE